MWQGIDQRRFPRAQYKCMVNLCPPGGTSAISAMTENIGLGGVCLLLEKGLDIFAPVEIEMTLDDGKGPLQVKGTIVWVVQRRVFRKNSSFDTGVEFAELSPEDKARIEAVLDKANSGKKS